jgi:hypothetical protein
MANVEEDYCTYPSPSGLGTIAAQWILGFFHSDIRKALAHRKWPLHVRLQWPMSPGITSFNRSFNFIRSWEFVTTLDYEWDVFRGRRRYLKTIWVRN